MSIFTVAVTTSFGLESIVSWELKDLGIKDISVENGMCRFAGDKTDIARCNMWLRCAERVFIEMGTFPAGDFDELYEGISAISWHEYIPRRGKMHVTGKSVSSRLHSVPSCQSISKRAIVDVMQKEYSSGNFPEDGPRFRIEVSLLKDTAVVYLDTSGPGLHRRGYRLMQGEAPLRETLAAAMVKLSRRDSGRVLADPFCGSGTIPIEAAMAARTIAPGMLRNFDAEQWFFIPEKIWREAREEAGDMITKGAGEIFASDSDFGVFRVARDNAARAGVHDDIIFQKKPVQEFSSRKKFGCMVTNPPYGERISSREEAAELYRVLGSLYESLDTWSFFILSSHPGFAGLFGRKPDKNRKLYNGKIKTYLYQYLRPLK